MRGTPEDDRSHLLHTARPTPARQPTRGEHVWTATKDGRRVDCELRYHGDTYGWECQFLSDGELVGPARRSSCGGPSERPTRSGNAYCKGLVSRQ
jgi:hypothetical protein